MLPNELAKRSLFAGLAPEQLARLAPLCRPVRFAAGEKIFAQGDLAQRVFILERGEVALQLYPEDGGCLTIAVIHPEGIFGWSAALGRSRYTSAAVCVVDATALMMRGNELRAVVQAEPQLGRLLLGRMALAVAGRTGDDPVHLANSIHDEMNSANS